MPASLVERIKMLAQQRNTSIKRIERECGIANATIRKWETQGPSLESIKRVAENLHVSLDYIVYGEEGETASGGLTLSDDEVELIALYRQLNHADKIETRNQISTKLSLTFMNAPRAGSSTLLNGNETIKETDGSTATA